MTVELNLTYVDRKERVSAKTNKPFTSMSIKCTQYGEKYLSGFGNKDNAGWKVGDKVTVEAVREVSKEDKIYLNFDMPRTGASDLAKRMEKLEGEFFKFKLAVIEEVNKLRPVDSTYPSREKEIGLKEGEVHPWMKPEAPVSASMPVTGTPDHTTEDDGLEHLSAEDEFNQM